MWKRAGDVLTILRNAHALLLLAGTALTVFLLWWADETGPKVQMVFVPPLLIVLGIAVLIWRKKRRFQGQIVAVGSPSLERTEWWYSRRARQIAKSILAVAALLIVGDVIWIGQLLIHPTTSVLLVADFEGPQPASYRVTETLIENLRAATRFYPDIRVVAAGKPVKSSSEARLLGLRKASSVMIWGWYGATPTNVQLHVNFEIFSKPVQRYFRGEGYTTTVALAEMNSFELQARFSREMSCVSLIAVGLARYESGDFAGAVARLTDAIKLSTTPAEIIDPNMMYYMRGLALFKKGDDLAAAISDYTLIIKAKPDHVDAHTNRGACYLKRGMYVNALSDFDAVLGLRPGSAQAFHNRGVANAMRGEPNLAVADFSRVIAMDPKDPLTYYERAMAYRFLGDLNAAILDYSAAIRLKPDLAGAYHNRGNCYAVLGRHQEAIGDFTKAIELQPTALSFNERGASQRRLGRLDLAIKDFSSALKLDSKMLNAHYNRGDAYLADGKLDRARKDFEAVIGLNEDYAAGYFGRGSVLYTEKQFKAAVEAYSHAIKLDPNFAEAYFNRGVAYVDLKNRSGAAEDLLHALRLSSSDELRAKILKELNYIGIQP
ncbi:MAG: tetratricopeptide repeat protein [Planctomycetota bacterium]